MDPNKKPVMDPVMMFFLFEQMMVFFCPENCGPENEIRKQMIEMIVPLEMIAHDHDFFS